MQAFRRLRERAQGSTPWVVDAALVLLVAATRVLQYELEEAGHDPAVGDELWAVLAVVTALPLLLRRRFPLGVLLAVGGGELLLLFIDLHAVPVALLIATYTLAAVRTQRESLLALLLVLAASTVAIAVVEGPALVLESTVSLGMAWALGALQNARRRYANEARRRLELLEREREVEAQLAVTHERARIARELHDVVAHGVSVMVMQAAGARESLSSDHARADAAMAEVERTGRQSLAELRQLLGLLHREGEPADRAPQPGLDRLDELLEGFRRAQLPVDVVIQGERRKLPTGVDVSAFRIIQEALTNVIKHAGLVPVTLTLRFEEDGVGVQIVNRSNGRAPQTQHGSVGRGLIGMRERVMLLGGTFAAGPQPGGEFRIDCHLPVAPP
jgi:signal transduction histidine kinase